MEVIAFLGFTASLIIFVFYRRYVKQQTVKREVLQHIDHIRQHQVLIKPDKDDNTFSGKFAGRRLRFALGKVIEIHTDLIDSPDTDTVWIYPVKHLPKDSKLRETLEKNRAWTGSTDFDAQYILAGRPRHLANAIMHPAKRVQAQLLNYPQTIIVIDNGCVTLRPNPRQPYNLTTDDWRDLMGLIADIAQYAESQYDAPMFSGIEHDESAYPKHDGGHVN